MTLAESVIACFNEIDGSTVGFDYRYLGPDDQSLDDHVFLFAPQPVRISGGPDDGAVVCEPLTVDIQASQQLFTELDSTEYRTGRGKDWYRRRCVELSGKVGDRSVTPYIFDEPLGDAEIQEVLDGESQPHGGGQA